MSGTPYTYFFGTVSGSQVSSGLQVGNAGGFDVIAGGVASDTLLLNYGPNTLESPSVIVFSGGTLVDTTIEVGSVELSGGIFEPNPPAGSSFMFNTTIEGPSAVIAQSTGAFLGLYAGVGIVSGGIASGGSVLFGYVSAYGATSLISGFTVTSGGIAEIRGAAASGISLGATAQELVQAGGSSYGTEIGSGAAQIVGGFAGSAGSASGAVVHGGGVQHVGLTRDDGFGTVVFDGVAFDTVVQNGGTQTIALLSVASGTTAEAGATIVVSSAGIASGATLSGATQTVLSSGIASGTTVDSGGVETVASGGSAVASLVASSGAEVVQGGGYASGIEVGAGGTLTNSGTTSGIGVDASGSAVDSGIDIQGVVNFGGVENVYGAASGTDVLNGGLLFVAGAASGTFIAGGGRAIVQGAASATTIDGGTLEVASGATLAGPLVFSGSGGALVVDAGPAPANPISGFGFGDTVDFKSLHYSAATPVVAGDSVTVALGGTVETLAIAGAAALPGFVVVSASDGSAELEAAPCFRAGTRLSGANGPVRVETIRQGDRLVTAAGGFATVRWVGFRQIACVRHRRPDDVWPIRVMADAFGPQCPRTDLFLSPDHAILVAGVLIPARLLVNGRTVAQVRCGRVEYWHVELERHDTVLAEGLACESYLDTGNRGAFANGGAPMHLHPDFALQVWKTQGCAPLMLQGPRVAEARRHLLARAAALGFAVSDDPALAAVADGRPLRLERDGRRRRVLLPRGSAEILHLASRRWTPAHMRPDEADTRRLGVAVSGLWLDGRPVGLDSANLAAGWHAPEPHWRWTDGDAHVPVSGVRDVTVEIAMAGSYWRDEGTHAAQAAGAAPAPHRS